VPGGNLLVLGVILVLCALFLKRGIVGTAMTLWDRAGRRFR
jgi:ABC-type branched-subunit amino acid transport system permease subunit